MSKLNILFNNNNYAVDESSLASAMAELKSHFSTTMNGSGATIKLGGVSYNVDSTKLTNARNDFISHLGTISGNGSKVKVNGVEYSVDSSKLTNVISVLQNTFGELQSGSSDKLAAGLYQNGVMVKSWDELISENIIGVEDGCVVFTDKSIAGDLVGSDDVTSIWDEVFSNCNSLTSVSFPNCTSIGKYAVANCNSLIMVDFPLVTTIGHEVFEGCTSLTTVNFPNATRIGECAFISCGSLTTINLPLVTIIDNDAFNNCAALTTVELSSCTSIGQRAFNNCTSLTNITFNGTTAQWDSITKGKLWNQNVPATYVQCSDGQVAL